MKRQTSIILAVFIAVFSQQAVAQDGNIKTVFKNGLRSSGGYAALTNKFTNIGGDYANLAGFYGGWFVNHRLLIGVGAAASTNDLHVPQQFSTEPNQRRTWQYGQFGLTTEYVMSSDKPIHLAFHLFSGAGFTLQYERREWDHNERNNTSDENWFVVAEPGVQLEINLFKWMRLSPGISYRATFGSDGRGLDDSDLSGLSYNATLKLGRF